MDSATKKFDKRLRELLIYSGAKRENLARFVGVTMPEMNRSSIILRPPARALLLQTVKLLI